MTSHPLGTLWALWPLWKEALAALGITVPPATSDTDLLDESFLDPLLSGSLWQQTQLRWRIEAYARKTTPADASARKVRSLALGIAQRALLLQLPSHSEWDLALWLASPQKAPRGVRRTLQLIQTIQHERNRLSPVWEGVLPQEIGPTTSDPPSVPSPTSSHTWRGLPVCSGIVEGPCWVVPPSALSAPKTEEIPPHAAIFLFTSAHPKTVSLFPHARALLFLEGGILSHACSVARERGIPAITAMGSGFLAVLERTRPPRIHMDAGTGAVTFLKEDGQPVIV